MMIEIERKFLVKNLDFKSEALAVQHITQGFLNTHPERTVRVRLKNESGTLTVKGISNHSGTSRFEWETKINKADAQKLLAICEPGIIEKERYIVPVNSHTFEVDVFLGANKGLIIAEIELTSEDETFEKPSWLGKEVTGDKRYYNSFLSKSPYLKWNK